jgi:hypothetical protein
MSKMSDQKLIYALRQRHYEMVGFYPTKKKMDFWRRQLQRKSDKVFLMNAYNVREKQGLYEV